MNFESTNLILDILDISEDKFISPIYHIPKQHAEELRDLLNDYLEMERKNKL